MTNLRRGVRVAAILLTPALMLAGCGEPADQSGDAGEPPTEASPESPRQVAEPPTSETTTPSETVQPSWAYSATWHYANVDAYTFDMTIDLGEPMTGEEAIDLPHPAQEGFTAGGTCGFDAQTDALLPGLLTVKATTAGFDTPVSTSFTINATAAGAPGDDADGRVGVEQNYSDGPVCTGLSSENYGVSRADVKWSNAISPGGSNTHEFFLVLRDYFSPLAPDGDRTWLQTHAVVPTWGGSNTSEEARRLIYEPNVSEISALALDGSLIE